MDGPQDLPSGGHEADATVMRSSDALASLMTQRCKAFAVGNGGGDTCGVRLFGQGFPPDDVFVHPRHQATQKALPELILQLRAAANVKDGLNSSKS